LSLRIQPQGKRADAGLEAFLNRLDGGAIIINRDGEVAALNASAEILLGDGLRFHQKRLYTSSHNDQSKLDRLLQTAFNQAIENIGSLAVARPSGKRALILQAVPLAKDYFPGQRSKRPGSILLLIFDLETSKGPPDFAALNAIGLSPAESKVAIVVGSGLSPQEASDHLGITVLTVRTHLKNIYQKLDLQRQGDLVQLVTKLRMVK
jgi:DNA-binding CsgD family transcriptional regulator